MSQLQEPSTAAPDEGDDLVLPLGAIVCIAIGGYLVLVVILLFVRSLLLQRGILSEQCNCCGKEGETSCCECWIACAEACNCCKNPNLTVCLDSLCPRRKQMDCADLILCNVCMDDSGQCSCCGGPEPMCDCGNCNCNCNCQPPDCQDVNCLCCQLQPKGPDADLDSNAGSDI